MRSMANATEAENEHDALALARLMRTLNFLRHPTVARVNGHAFGGGVGLLACCDIVIAADSARLGLTETRLGLVPAVISPYVYRRIGEGQARRYFLTGERFGAETARGLGLVHEVTTPETLDQRTGAIVDELLKSGPQAVAAAKQLVSAVAGNDEDAQLKLDGQTARLIARLRISREGQEGLAAFLEKRKPDWSGSADG